MPVETLNPPPTEVPCPIIGLGNGFPDKVFALKHEPSGKWGCYRHDGIHGLACFSDKKMALEFGTYIELPGMLAIELSFDEARFIAQERPLPIVAILLCDDIDDPVIHYVR